MNIYETYMLWEQAGDNYCGGMASGLPVLSHKFACLPPSFVCLKMEGETEAENLHQKIDGPCSFFVD